MGGTSNKVATKYRAGGIISKDYKLNEQIISKSSIQSTNFFWAACVHQVLDLRNAGRIREKSPYIFIAYITVRETRRKQICQWQTVISISQFCAVAAFIASEVPPRCDCCSLQTFPNTPLWWLEIWSALAIFDSLYGDIKIKIFLSTSERIGEGWETPWRLGDQRKPGWKWPLKWNLNSYMKICRQRISESRNSDCKGPTAHRNMLWLRNREEGHCGWSTIQWIRVRGLWEVRGGQDKVTWVLWTHGKKCDF